MEMNAAEDVTITDLFHSGEDRLCRLSESACESCKRGCFVLLSL
jgi:hypothetical protein